MSAYISFAINFSFVNFSHFLKQEIIVGSTISGFDLISKSLKLFSFASISLSRLGRKGSKTAAG